MDRAAGADWTALLTAIEEKAQSSSPKPASKPGSLWKDNLESRFTRDFLLAVVALHWATATFTPLDVRRLAPRGCCNVQHMATAGGTSTKPMVIIGGGKAGAPQPRLCATRVSAGRP